LSKGIATEVLFEYICLSNNLIVSRPVTDVPYDRLIDNGKKILKVQIKHTTCRRANRPNAYKFNMYTRVGGEKKNVSGYADVLAIYVEPESSWYLIPTEDLPESKDMAITIGGKWEKYKDNWDILYAQE
jgi:PD-(D/E)XK endonuclease